MRHVAILMAMAGGLSAEVAGTPVAPRPGNLPDAWFSWTNDALSGEIGDNTDDFRTSAFQFQARIHDRLLLCLDHSTLTNKARAYQSHSRADEATATVGWQFGGQHVGQPWLAPGAGLRVYGDLGGEALQNAWHRGIGIDEVDYLDYDDGDAVGLAYLAAGWTVPLAFIPRSPFLERGQFALAVTGQGALTSEGLAQGSLEADLAVLGQDGAVWLGVRVSDETGRQSGPTAEAVGEHEEGWWATYGGSVGGWFIAGGIEPHTRAATGRVGWQWGRGPGRIDPNSRALMAGELTALPGPSLGAGLRWQPRWLADMPMGQRTWITTTYRFGRTGVVWDDNVVVFDQATLGVQLTGKPLGNGLHWEPYAEAGVGGRAERVVVRGDSPRYSEERVITGVASGGMGMRLVWGQPPAGDRTARYGLGLGLEGWLPFEQERIANATTSDHYNTPGWNIGLSVSVLAQW